MVDNDLLYNPSEALLRRLKPLNPVTIMVSEGGDSKKHNFLTVQDTDEIERVCHEKRKHAIDLRFSRNKSRSKGLQFASVPQHIIDRVVGYANFVLADGLEKKKMMMRIVTEYPEFLVTKKNNIGMV